MLIIYIGAMFICQRQVVHNQNIVTTKSQLNIQGSILGVISWLKASSVFRQMFKVLGRSVSCHFTVEMIGNDAEPLLKCVYLGRKSVNQNVSSHTYRVGIAVSFAENFV